MVPLIENLTEIAFGEMKLAKLNHRGRAVTVERLDAEDIRESARRYNGTFNSDFGVYFVLTSAENECPVSDLMSDSQLYGSCFLGQSGVVMNRYSHEGKLIFDGPDLCDSITSEKDQGKGYCQLLTELRLLWLRHKGHREAFFPDCEDSESIVRVFEGLHRKGKLNLEQIHELPDFYGAGKPRRVYKVSF